MNSSHTVISYAVFCLKKKKKNTDAKTDSQSKQRPYLLRASILIHCYSNIFSFFFFTHPDTTEIYTLSLHDALPISESGQRPRAYQYSIVTNCPFQSTGHPQPYSLLFWKVVRSVE